MNEWWSTEMDENVVGKKTSREKTQTRYTILSKLNLWIYLVGHELLQNSQIHYKDVVQDMNPQLWKTHTWTTQCTAPKIVRKKRIITLKDCLKSCVILSYLYVEKSCNKAWHCSQKTQITWEPTNLFAKRRKNKTKE